MQSTYDAFMRTNPTLEAFEVELKKYMALETEIAAITAVHNIGKQADSVCLSFLVLHGRYAHGL